MAASEQIEVELKFDVDASTDAPDLRVLPGVVGAREPETFQLDATYFDTENLDLASNKITMRRRTGGHDSGWHLKRPTAIAGARRELQVGFDEAPDEVTPPTALTDPVRVLIRSRPLIPVAVISTQRTVTTLLGAGDEPIAELAADLVTAQSLLPGGHSSQWAEWEFELLGDTGNNRLLKAASRMLTRAGGREPSSASKLARAIGATPAVSNTVPGLGKNPTALDLVLTDLATHRNALLAWDPQVRVDAYDAVHQMRVSSRRLRSVLTGFKGVLDDEKTTHLDGELRLLARILGDARDSEVQIDIDISLLEGEDVSDALRAALVGQEEIGHERALRVAHAAMNSDRYFALLDDIDELIADPPTGPLAEATAEAAADKSIGRSRKRIRQEQNRLAALPEGSDEWLEQLHVVRKKAKRLRYRVDAVAPLGKKHHHRAGKVAKVIQTALGDVNDALINRQRIAELVAQAQSGELRLEPRDLFVLGRVDTRQAAAMQRAIGTYSSVLKDL
ncbi:CHAD domain-containing protein [Gordonia pseudamarae]|uniref:CHAD domain-containing protein n=1 Tax=Gordonia pseudamarae TaxID=2831662 RepID=A0ABX6IIP3_9ACTN|nr:MULTISPECIES: CYTH and CHAD domain-containing protein [Gordonia]MBD0022571.1 CYTH and CHAD domain-containing protein [Gordonia sp. (in: high G+C Gram-positive bacteria)]QHN26862.1 CHAD domain-containing protein [Gordonia pseudamarae]QHN35753.1 CHAD domain-containing protein [Gordonia pseudamarae]